jgi:para-aminobenzoate synthetase
MEQQQQQPCRTNGEPGWRILFLDAYDSFSNNIVSLLKQTLGDEADVEVQVLHVDLKTPRRDQGSGDWTTDEFLRRLDSFDAVVCGPGPGSPSCERDVGAFRLLWQLSDEKLLPVLGICLGFQSLVTAFGGEIRRLRRGMHGMTRGIEHRQSDIFDHVPPFSATLYHSLCADIGQHEDVASWNESRWSGLAGTPHLLPLAWMQERSEESIQLDGDDDGNERVLMAVRHREKPFWGLQYHPESVRTDEAAHGALKNWFREARRWNVARNRRRAQWTPSLTTTPTEAGQSQTSGNWLAPDGDLARRGIAQTYAYRRVTLPQGIDAADIMEILDQADGEAIVLDSSSARTGDALAKNSIVAMDVDKALRLEYHVGDDYIILRGPKDDPTVEQFEKLSLKADGRDGGSSVWDTLTDFWRRRIPDAAGPGGFADCAFKGGFMGYITYEMGLSSILDVPSSIERGHQRPDICFAWVDRSVVLDHKAGVAFVQAIGPETEIGAWLDETVSTLESSTRWHDPQEKHATGGGAKPATNENLIERVRYSTGQRLQFSVPEDAAYARQVELCQESIRAGESYELCLTAATRMTRPREPVGTSHLDQGSTWSLFRELRKRQPAPFGSFIRIGGTTLVSSSPERFLTHDPTGLCSMRPMKGTVRKSETVSTLAQAEKILHCPKEEAENLMIVDLVRHDLHGICGPGQVTVPELLKVEEYATVFQMVTAVNGQLPIDKLKRTTESPSSSDHPFHGLHVLEAALPPGSMTGAPKARSCEILRGLERRERGLYSGVVGFFDVTGRADWSVTIRSMFRHDDEREEAGGAQHEVWHIGAGGAVTILSTPRGETEEMFTKLCGPLGVFNDTA